VGLDGGTDGLDVLRRVTAEACDWLAPGGVLLFETSDRQVQRAVDIATRDGLVPRVVTSEDLDATVIIGTRQAVGP
jgi:release factor glutamine methyltransferase